MQSVFAQQEMQHSCRHHDISYFPSLRMRDSFDSFWQTWIILNCMSLLYFIFLPHHIMYWLLVLMFSGIRATFSQALFNLDLFPGGFPWRCCEYPAWPGAVSRGCHSTPHGCWQVGLHWIHRGRITVTVLFFIVVLYTPSSNQWAGGPIPVFSSLLQSSPVFSSLSQSSPFFPISLLFI